MIRSVQPDERAFVRETCAKVRWPRGLSWSEWSAGHGPTLDGWLHTGACLVYEHEGVVLGFLLATDQVIRCLYVKRDFRGAGIGMALLKAWAGERGHAVKAWRPTPSWRRWAHGHGLLWDEATEAARAA